MFTLNDNQQAQLERFIGELPTKFGNPLLTLLQSFDEENKKAAAKPKEETPQ